MSAITLSNQPSDVNANVDEVVAWAERSGERGILNPTTARLKISALRRFVSVLGSDEQFGAQDLLNQLDSLLTRYARKEGGVPDTLSTYKQRAESLLTDFIEYHRDPLGFQARNTERPKKDAERKPERKKASAPSAPSAPEPVQEAATPAPGARRHTFPLENGRIFAYELPADGLTFRDVKKLQLHLISVTTDFDLSEQNSMELTRQLRIFGRDE
jgi:hypothetical protein